MAVAIDSAGRTTSPTPEAGATRGALIGAIRAAIDGEAAASPTGR